MNLIFSISSRGFSRHVCDLPLFSPTFSSRGISLLAFDKESAMVLVLSRHRCNTFLIVLPFGSVCSNEQENLLSRRAGSEQEMVSLK